MRLNKFLARCGVSSRRKCDDLIQSGKVEVNGQKMINFGYIVKEDDLVICNGELINVIPKMKVYLVNKMKGYISTSLDPAKRKRVIDLVPSQLRLFTIGRLDRDTTGAILVTNDGDLANELMHPRNQIERIYFATSKKHISKAKRDLLKQGLKLEDGNIAYGELYHLERKRGLNYWKVILREGKNHEVKHIFQVLGSKIIDLHRQSFSGLSIDKVLPGKFRELSATEIDKLYSTANVTNTN